MLIRLAQATPENAGAKAAVLGRLATAGFPVPPAFVIPVDAYRTFTDHLNFADILAHQGSAEVRRLIETQPLPPDLLNELTKALAELGDVPVAVRSSATTEDTAEASAAGQHDTYLGVQGTTAVANRVRACWSSLWSHRATTYHQTLQPPHEPAIAVVVQRHVGAEVAGVLFATAEGSIIEASWGLGESVVQGLVTPDAFTVTAAGAIGGRLGSKETRIDRRFTRATVTTPVPRSQRERLCLTDSQLRQLDELGQAVTAHLGSPQDIEFALDSTRLWLLQSRPITAPLLLGRHPAVDPRSEVGEAGTATGKVRGEVGGVGTTVGEGQGFAAVGGVKVLRGVGGSAGTVSGVARVVEGAGDFGRVGVGEILVCRFTDPGWTPLFGIVAGVVTEIGGRLSHAAIVAREHRIPAVLGVSDVMTTVRDGQMITVAGSTGTVELADKTSR